MASFMTFFRITVWLIIASIFWITGGLSEPNLRIVPVDRALALEYVGPAGLEMTPIPRAALFLAGKVFTQYRRAGGSRTGVLPDFFIGAHAAVSQLPLLTRDIGRYRTYFPTLSLITPHP